MNKLAFFATEAIQKRAGFMPRGELTPEQQAQIEQAKSRWLPGNGGASAPVTDGMSSPAARAVIGAGAGALGGGGLGLAVGGPIGAAIGAPVGALLGGFHGHGAATEQNALIEEAMRRGAYNQFDLDTLPQNTVGAIDGVSTQLATNAAMRRFGI
jgi:hypothetical protein